MNIGLIKAIIILPGTARIYVPALIIWLTRDTLYEAGYLPKTGLVWLAGLSFALAGIILMYWTMKLFNTKGGGGTPAPWEPIKNFIVEGPYRFVRNPTLLGVNLFLVAEALLLRSLPILLWMIAFFVLNTVYFVLSEEPELEKRYGKPYVDYKHNVSRWIPRLSPYIAHNDR
jgi:protein-S-isoprenylcysteine O-methyltransferase Ste14